MVRKLIVDVLKFIIDSQEDWLSAVNVLGAVEALSDVQYEAAEKTIQLCTAFINSFYLIRLNE